VVFWVSISGFGCAVQAQIARAPLVYAVVQVSIARRSSEALFFPELLPDTFYEEHGVCEPPELWAFEPANCSDGDEIPQCVSSAQECEKSPIHPCHVNGWAERAIHRKAICLEGIGDGSGWIKFRRWLQIVGHRWKSIDSSCWADPLYA
jgi:hypothetical protein